MGKLRTIILSTDARAELESGYRNSDNLTFSRRCHMILLKSESRTSQEVAKIVGATLLTINRWLDRYESEGIEGLRTRVGQGRKPILKESEDSETVRKVVQRERQQLKQAKYTLETELNKSFSLSTLKRFLKNLAADGNESV